MSSSWLLTPCRRLGTVGNQGDFFWDSHSEGSRDAYLYPFPSQCIYIKPCHKTNSKCCEPSHSMSAGIHENYPLSSGLFSENVIFFTHVCYSFELWMSTLAELGRIIHLELNASSFFLLPCRILSWAFQTVSTADSGLFALNNRSARLLGF